MHKCCNQSNWGKAEVRRGGGNCPLPQCRTVPGWPAVVHRWLQRRPWYQAAHPCGTRNDQIGTRCVGCQSCASSQGTARPALGCQTECSPRDGISSQDNTNCQPTTATFYHPQRSNGVKRVNWKSKNFHCSNNQNGLPFWRRLNQVVLEKRPLNGRSSSNIFINYKCAFSALTLLVGWRASGLKKIKWRGAGMVIYLQWGAHDLHMVQLMPLPPHHHLLH